LLSNTLSKSPADFKGQNYSSLASIRDTALSSQLVDILITHDWPVSITSHSSVSLPSPEFASSGSPPLDSVIQKVRPRYHFAGGGGHPPRFWEREPFTWVNEGGRVTRFVSLGAFGGEQGAGKRERVGRITFFWRLVVHVLSVVLCIQHCSIRATRQSTIQHYREPLHRACVPRAQTTPWSIRGSKLSLGKCRTRWEASEDRQGIESLLITVADHGYCRWAK